MRVERQYMGEKGNGAQTRKHGERGGFGQEVLYEWEINKKERSFCYKLI